MNADRQPWETVAPALAVTLYAALSELPRGALNIKMRRTKCQHVGQRQIQLKPHSAAQCCRKFRLRDEVALRSDKTFAHVAEQIAFSE